MVQIRHRLVAGVVTAMPVIALATGADRSPASAQNEGGDAAAPRIVAIEFTGNRITRPETLLREMAVSVGDVADAKRLADSRQAIEDLGLFRSVSVNARSSNSDAVIDVAVRERRYLLPVPRLNLSSDLDRSAGLSVRWNNLWGRNHTLSGFIEGGRYPADRLRESEQRARLSYEASHVFGNLGFSTSLERSERDVPGEAGSYAEDIDIAEALLMYDFRDARPRRGWIGMAGLRREERRSAGSAAPPSDGVAKAVVLAAAYDDLRDHTYSDSGRRGAIRTEFADTGLLSDYSYWRLDGEYARLLALSAGDHHTLNLIGAAGVYRGGTGQRNAYDLGGSTRMRGYDSDYLQGERYGYASVEYLRPLGRDWIRLLLVGEVGGSSGTVVAARSGGPYASIGAGVRVKATWFVNLEFELGFAWPLRGGDGMRFFASSGE